MNLPMATTTTPLTTPGTGGRRASVERATKETRIAAAINLDGTGVYDIKTGIGFLDHMLEQLSRHSLIDITLRAEGDLHIDYHHTTEDAGIVLGQAIREAVGDKKGIRRYGYFVLPMDDALALCAVDLCGRPYLNFDASFPTERVGGLDTELVREFFYAVSYSAGMNLHLKVMDGTNAHHMIEAMFKAFAKALDGATGMEPRVSDVLSTKGTLS